MGSFSATRFASKSNELPKIEAIRPRIRYFLLRSFIRVELSFDFEEFETQWDTLLSFDDDVLFLLLKPTEILEGKVCARLIVELLISILSACVVALPGDSEGTDHVVDLGCAIEDVALVHKASEISTRIFMLRQDEDQIPC